MKMCLVSDYFSRIGFHSQPMLIGLITVGMVLTGCQNGAVELSQASDPATNGFSSPRAIGHVEEICQIGNRATGSVGMTKQQALLEKKFKSLKWDVEWQTFEQRHPESGDAVEIKNLIASIDEKSNRRILICAHYDTRPFPDRDLKSPRGKFVGANDGASGVALVLELANQLPKTSLKLGVDLVLFDAEELVYREGRDQYFLGSTYFAQNYRQSTSEQRYVAGVLVDMIGDKNLALNYEENSLRYARDVSKGIWKVAADLKVKEFIPKVLHNVRDDHLPLNEIAGIPTCDIIDMDYPGGRRAVNFWHTEQDTPDKCSGESICKVANVIYEWLKLQQ